LNIKIILLASLVNFVASLGIKTSLDEVQSLELWHCCLGHVNKTMIKKMEILGVVNGLQINNKVEEFCHGCAHGNNHRIIIGKSCTSKSI
jgi:hypothetical protein